MRVNRIDRSHDRNPTEAYQFFAKTATFLSNINLNARELNWRKSQRHGSVAFNSELSQSNVVEKKNKQKDCQQKIIQSQQAALNNKTSAIIYYFPGILFIY